MIYSRINLFVKCRVHDYHFLSFIDSLALKFSWSNLHKSNNYYCTSNSKTITYANGIRFPYLHVPPIIVYGAIPLIFNIWGEIVDFHYFTATCIYRI